MELDWDWARIAIAIMWKLSPNGVTLFKSDLDLPKDRVLLETREPNYIDLKFITLKEASTRTHAPAKLRASTEKLTGRWQQYAAVMLWKLKKNGVRLTTLDEPPGALELLTSGHPDGIEFRFLPKLEARAMHIRERDQEGRIMTEHTH